jgi:tetratricopeptide (TPR) repeat protein/predicted Ser/Thr protein kinase
MSTTTDLPPAPSGPGGDPAPDPDAPARTGALGDIRKFLDDAAEELPGPDAPLGEIAVSRGYVTEAQLEECLGEQKVTTPHILIGELLLRHKYITGEQLLRALAAQKKPDLPPQLPEGAKIGKYSLIREIGRGGMGVVFEAEDPDLRRRVAIKVLKDEVSDPTAAERMKREAAIAAQLRHSGIVAIYETSTTGPRGGLPLPYIVMDFVEGRTLAELIEEEKTPRKELLRILEDVSRAVAHAHGAGVVHRDLKPANVIVEKSGRAVLTDFGIARATSFQTRITETSFVVGTPEYMAPEQIEDHADKVGPATDIHALGVMLYEILTGTLPYRAEAPVALMRKIVSEEPLPPRRIAPAVERDLETICLKALEKEGNRRYATADAFADDLLRFRTGKRIAARPDGPVARTWRKILRRKRLSLLVGGAVAATLLLVLLLGASARRERREATRELNERMETALRAAMELRRAGDLPRMKSFAAEALEACAAASRRHPELAEPHALQGRMHRSLMNYDRALEEQELALARDPGCSRARYERITLTSRLLRRREDDLLERAWRSLGEKLIQERSSKVRAEDVSVPSRQRLSRDDAAARELRERMSEDLRELEAPGAEEIGAAELACARGLAARSRGPLQTALTKAPFLEEAVEALAMLEEDAGRFEKAVAVWSDGLEHDKGCLAHLEGRGEARLHWGQQKFQRGEDPADVLIAAVGDFTQALEKDPKRDGAMRERGLAHFLLGYSIGWVRLDDATRQFQSAAEDLGRSLELNPKAAPTWMWRGVVRAALSVSKLLHWEDPIPLCKEAMTDLSKAIERNPRGDEPYLWRAFVRIPWSVQLAVRHEDVEPLYRDALADLEQALRLNPGRGETWLGRANIHLAWATYQSGRGKDTREVLGLASADLDVAIKKTPEGIQAPLKRGQTELMLAALPVEDALSRCRSAVECYETALARNPASAAGIAGRGEARMRLGAELARRGENPAAAFEGAFRDLDEAVKADPAARILRAEACVHRGGWKAAAGREGDADYQAALADTKLALEANALATEGWVWQGRAKTLSAASRPVPILHYSEAINDLNKVLFFAPDHLQALRFRADAHQRLAVLKAGRRGDAAADFKAALIDYEHVVRLQPGFELELRDAIAACKSGLESSKR